MNYISESISLHSILNNSPGNPLIWNKFLIEIAEQLNCDSSLIVVTDLINRDNTHILFSANISAKYKQQYANRLNKIDHFNHYISKYPGQVFCNQNVDLDLDKTVQSSFMFPSKERFRFGVSLPCNHSYSLNLLLNRKRIFNKQEQKYISWALQDLIPELEEAMHAEQLYKINSQLLHVINDHFDGYIIVDKDLNILFSDPIYNSIIKQMEGVRLEGNKFGMKNPVIEQDLIKQLNTNKLVPQFENDCQSCNIALTPISSLHNLYEWECYKDGFILTFTDNNGKNPISDRLTEIYHLSRCEANCALHFMKTPSISDIANNTFRSQETVRNHMKHMMQKMGVHNQAELMKTLIAIAAL